jgi:predicted neuraminidase
MKVIDGDITVGSSYSQAEINSRRQMMGLVYHLQTKGYQGKVYDTYKLRYVCPGLGIREGRRIVGEYYLTEDDLRTGRHFHDAVAVGTYQIDYHWPDVLQRAGTGITDQVPPYHIPYRSLIPKNGKNIAVAGRCVSGDQMAMASFRVMSTCAHTGLAAGMGCSLATEDGRDLPDLNVSKLQTALVSKGLNLNTTPYRRFRRQRRMVSEGVLEDERPQPLTSSSLLELDDSETLVVWAEGTDPEIWSARRVEGSWQPPVRVIGKGIPASEPALFSDPEGDIHLVYDAGEEGVTRIITSPDGGLTWEEPRNLLPVDMSRSSFGNRVLVSSSGEWFIFSSVPVGDAVEVFVDISSDSGKTWQRNRVSSLEDEIVRSVLWESSPGVFHIFIGTGSGVMLRSDSGDGGSTWSPVYDTDLQCSQGRIDLATMEDGELALVQQAAGAGGDDAKLAVILSEDNGRTWPHEYLLEEGSASACSPSIIPSPEGISLTYTRGRNIAFWRLSVEHLKDLM